MSTSVHFLLGTKPRHRQKLIQALQAIAAEPLQKGDFAGKDTLAAQFRSRLPDHS
jgi:hypothetical protein